MRLVRVETEELRLADAAVDGTGEDDGMITQDIRERDRGSSEDAAPKVVPGVTDCGARDVVGGKPHPIGVERELVRVGECQRRRVEQGPHGHGRKCGGRLCGLRLSRRAEAAGRAIDRRALTGSRRPRHGVGAGR